MKINDALRTLLVCPKCHGALQDDDAREGLRCDSCSLLYPVREGIPVMLPDEALLLAPKEE